MNQFSVPALTICWISSDTHLTSKGPQNNICWWNWSSSSKINFKVHLITMCDRWLHTTELLIAYRTACRAGFQKTKVLFLNIAWQNVLIIVLNTVYVLFDVVCNRCDTLFGAKKNMILFMQLKQNELFLELCVIFFLLGFSWAWGWQLCVPRLYTG